MGDGRRRTYRRQWPPAAAPIPAVAAKSAELRIKTAHRQERAVGCRLGHGARTVWANRPGTRVRSLAAGQLPDTAHPDKATAWAGVQGIPTAKCNCGNPLAPQELLDLTTAISTSTDGKNWQPVAHIPGEFVEVLATGDGVWVAAASQPWDWGRVTPPTRLFESTDLRTWHQVAALQDHVSGLAFADGHGTAVGNKASSGNGIVAWQSADARQWAVGWRGG